MDSTTKSACAEEPVTLIIDPDHTKRYIHKALLIHHSEYFRKALNGPWKEAAEGIVRLEDARLATVDIFIHWLYTGHLPHARDASAWKDLLKDERVSIYTTLMIAYSFADRFLVPELQRTLHNSLVDYFDVYRYASPCLYLTPELANQAFEIMQEDRPVLQLIVDNYCRNSATCCDRGRKLVDYPPAFLARTTRRMWELYEDAKWPQSSGERCYYEHLDDAEISACGKLHMRYDVERGIGIFGREVHGENCTPGAMFASESE
ncbi:hypothetical protein DE146DRAFT_680219 [Phaeosphaeria sp. MPI-PUGE-AT-0046c]|nr:hypothetical protein DE146DRAFT_680219 [Phaeosphaeria sp. MPI-PUGE-AT-0046c]